MQRGGNLAAQRLALLALHNFGAAYQPRIKPGRRRRNPQTGVGVHRFAHPDQLSRIIRKRLRVDGRPVVGVAIHQIGQALIAPQILFRSQDQQRVAPALGEAGDFFRGVLPSAGPDDEGLFKDLKGGVRGIRLNKVIQVRRYLLKRYRVALEIQALIDQAELKVLGVRQFHQLRQPAIQFLGILPTDDKAGDPRGLGPADMLLHHAPVVAGIATEQREIRFGPIPRIDVEPDVVVGEEGDRAGGLGAGGWGLAAGGWRLVASCWWLVAGGVVGNGASHLRRSCGHLRGPSHQHKEGNQADVAQPAGRRGCGAGHFR